MSKAKTVSLEEGNLSHFYLFNIFDRNTETKAIKERLGRSVPGFFLYRSGTEGTLQNLYCIKWLLL
jgi:hypothetical protein